MICSRFFSFLFYIIFSELFWSISSLFIAAQINRCKMHVFDLFCIFRSLFLSCNCTSRLSSVKRDIYGHIFEHRKRIIIEKKIRFCKNVKYCWLITSDDGLKCAYTKATHWIRYGKEQAWAFALMCTLREI